MHVFTLISVLNTHLLEYNILLEVFTLYIKVVFY